MEQCIQKKVRIDAVSGVIDQTTGSVSMRAIFPNKQNILRSGGMANVVFPYTMSDIILIPQNCYSGNSGQEVCVCITV